MRIVLHAFILLVAALTAACGRAAPVRVSPIRIVPPKSGECVGSIEVTVTNEGAVPVGIGPLVLELQDERSDYDPPLGPPGLGFASFGPVRSECCEMRPGESHVLTRSIIRTETDPSQPFEVGAFVKAGAKADENIVCRAPAARLDPADWPVAEPVTRESIDRAVAEGRGVRVAWYEFHEPGNGMAHLDVRPDGSAHGEGFGRVRGDDIEGLRIETKLTGAEEDALVAAVRDAPFGAFRVSPSSRSTCDGTPVRLVVAAGRSACVLSSQDRDFDAAGLEPLCGHLARLLQELRGKR